MRAADDCIGVIEHLLYDILRESFGQKLMRWTLRHLELAGFSLLLSVLVGIPLGIWASRGGAVGHIILGFAGVVQTIPSLALLALLVPLPFFGISLRTAIAALFLYGLLPIVRNTATGLQDIAQSVRDSAISAQGLEPGQAQLAQNLSRQLRSRSILTAAKASANHHHRHSDVLAALYRRRLAWANPFLAD